MKFRNFLFAFILCTLPTITWAQPGGAGPSDRTVPFGAVEYLLIAGAAIGVSRIWKKKR
ncbi:MAG: hypothetical protein AAF693_00790 [Bacteroidota bacterium]